MKKLLTLTLAMVLVGMQLVVITSCALRQSEIDPWLRTISGGNRAEIDITGRWRDTEGTGMFTWGEGYLHQEQSVISGKIGDYNIDGVVSGKIVYLVFLYRGRVYYTARLEKVKDSLIGYYFKASDKKQEKGYPTSFERTER